ncbi:MAG TPA: hypothetical protein PLT66_08920, partial [Bacillota bacterium]|nr:hypothetical protein [Bacillota bacterium]
CVYVPDAVLTDGEIIGYGFDISSYIDFEGSACLTNESGTTGFLISHKDVTQIDKTMTNVLVQPSTSEPLEVPQGAIGVYLKRTVKGNFEVISVGETRASSKYFTLILQDSYAKAFATDLMKSDARFLFVNTSLITKYGTSAAVEINGTGHIVSAIDPAEPCDGICLYDEAYGLLLSPEREGEFIDVLVFDGTVAYIGNNASRIVFPYPNGYMICFNGSESAAIAADIRIGDTVETVSVEMTTSPTAYVEINGNKIEIAYCNEYRSAVAYAVMYNEDYIHNSTDTNIWGMECAVNAKGIIESIVETSVTGVSGNTAIPDGGFVVSTGDNLYKTYLNGASVGDSAKYIEKEGMYSFRTIYDALYNKYGDGEYLSVITNDFSAKTNAVTNSVTVTVNANGYITAIAQDGRAVSVPEGGCVILATGVKKTELLRFCQLGQRVIVQSHYSRLLLFGEAELKKETYEELLTQMK